MIGFVLWLHHHCMCSGKQINDRVCPVATPPLHVFRKTGR
jgi:hypothetical protein